MTTVKKKLLVKVREKGEKKEMDILPAVLYGAKRKSTPLTLNKKEFNKLYEEAGESTLVALEIEGKKESPSVLIYEVQKNPLNGEVVHVDFFEPNLKEEVEAEIPLVFTGESPAVKEMEGTLVRNFYSINVKALPESLPHEVEVNIEILKELDDVIHIKDLNIPGDVEILHDAEGVVAMVSRPENVDEELEKPIEEEGEAEVIGEKEKEEEEKAKEEEIKGKESETKEETKEEETKEE